MTLKMYVRYTHCNGNCGQINENGDNKCEKHI